MVKAALRYAERGKPVFPLHSVDGRGVCSCGGPEVNPKCKPGKHPRTKRGHLDATTDPGRIRRWWKRWPTANIGIPTGSRSGLLVLDVDEWGAESLDSLEEEHGELPDTATTRTGSGGMHYLFKYPTGCGIGNSAGRLGLGLDMRGEGGYIVAPPSRTDKGPYAWLERRPLAGPPEWLLEALKERPGGSESKRGADAGATPALDGPPIPDGIRNDTLTAIAGRLHDGSRTLDQLAAALLEINEVRCVGRDGRTPEPLPEAEVREIARSIYRREPCKPAPEPDPETLENVEALFAGVLEHLEWKGRSGPTDRAVYAALLITARKFGRSIRYGVKVYISVRALALAAGTSHRTVIKALKRLERAKLVYRASTGQGTGAGALVLKLPQNFTTHPRGGCADSGERLRDVVRELLRVRWGPGRIGKSGALYLEHLYRLSSATAGELSERTGRRPDNVRRSLRKLEHRALVECFGGEYRLVPEFAGVLIRELELDGVPDAERLQRERHERQRASYVAWLEERRKERRRNRKPDGLISDLEPVRTSGISDQNPDRKTVDTVITDAKDPDQLRQLAALARERISEHRRESVPRRPSASAPEQAAHLLRRLQREDPECFAALCTDLRNLAWELSGRGWTQSIYSGNTLRAALELLEPERVAV